MRQYSTIFLLLIVLFAAAVLYIVTKPPGDVTLEQMLKVNPPPFDALTSQEQPISVDSVIHDTRKPATDTSTATATATATSTSTATATSTATITATAKAENTGILYYIIVESAKNLDIARQKSEKLKKAFKTDFIILPPTKEGFYRISIGKYSSFDEAKAAIDGVKRNIRSDAWIFSLKK